MVEATTLFDFDRSKLALSYDVERLQQETLGAIQDLPPYIFYSVIPLTVAGGRNKEVTDYSDPDWADWKETLLLKESPYFREVLDTLQCRKTNVRLMRLGAGWDVKEHSDPQLNLEFRNQIRLHVPIFVNDSVDFILNGTKVPLQPGELWYMRLSDPHSVHNNGSTERIQLSIDVVVNEWVEEMIISGEKP
ncbi:MAG: aspartyl/asparaginyl beta-hydroxylase domain-containing protein [Candidatus Kapaibacterium sp.]